MRRIAAFVFALLMVLPLFCLSTPADAGRLSIYRNHESDGLPFEVLNMLPGDVETKDYLVNVSYRGSVELFFQATVRKDTDADGNLVDPKLAEVLKCKVEIPRENRVLYDGLMKDVPECGLIINSPVGITEPIPYRITASLDTSVGNDYQNKTLIADFKWWVYTDSNVKPPVDPPKPKPDNPPYREELYKVHYDLDGATFKEQDSIPPKTVYRTESDLLPYGTPYKEGYTFTGWYYTNENGDKIKVTSDIKYMVVEPDPNVKEITLVATFEKIGDVVDPDKKYEVDYDLDGGTLDGKEDIPNKEVTWNENGLIPEGTPEKDGYIFEGWVGEVTDKDGNKTYIDIDNDTTYSEIAVTPDTEKVVIKAEFGGYDVNYDLDGGILDGKDHIPTKEVTYYESGLIPEGTPTKEGSYFTGWTVEVTNPDGSKTIINVTKDTPFSEIVKDKTVTEITVKANYSPVSPTERFEIIYDLGGGNIDGNTTIPGKTVTWDESGLIPEKAPVKDGYTFKGWVYEMPDPDGSGNKIRLDVDASTPYSELAGNPDIKTVVITAIYEKIPDGELINPPITGDDSNIILWIGVLACSVIALLIILPFLFGKKKDKKEHTDRTGRKLTAGLITIMLLACCLCFTTYALVYSEVMVEDNIFHTGTVKINLLDSEGNNLVNNTIIDQNSYIFEPGMRVEKPFWIENVGTADCYYRIFFDNVKGDLANILQVRITVPADATRPEKILYEGLAIDLTKDAVYTDKLEVYKSQEIKISFYFPSSAGNAYQNKQMSFNICAQAVQIKNNENRDFGGI